MKLEDIDNVLSEITHTQRSSLQDAEVVYGNGSGKTEHQYSKNKEYRK